MSRPKKYRHIACQPQAKYFKPRAIPLSQLHEVVLGVDEVEALRLCDKQKLSQQEAARKMRISQPTLQRILTKAHQKIAQALINGQAIKIEE